jgi:SRSO17 transposase
MPILGVPEFIVKVVALFSDLLTRPQRRQLARYVTGLLVGPPWTVRGITHRTVGATDQSNLNRFLTHSPWPEQQVNDRRVQVLESHPASASRPEGLLAIDDTLTEKKGLHIEGVQRYTRHDGGKILGHNVVTCRYVDWRTDWPVCQRRYRKREECLDPAEFRTKIELAQELLSEAKQGLGLAAQTAAFDAAYLCPAMTGHCAGLGLDWIAGCQPERRIMGDSGRRVSVAEYVKAAPAEHYRAVRVSGRIYYCFTHTVNMPSLKGRVRLLAAHERADRSDEVRLLVTNRREWSAHQVLRRYGHRWAIERGYRAAKRVLGFSAYQLRRMSGISKHWCLVWLAESLVPLCRAAGAPQKAARRFLRSTEALHHAARHQLLADLVDYVWQMFSEHRDPNHVKRILTAYA